MAKKYKTKNLPLTDQIALCAVAVLGNEVKETAFRMARPEVVTENENSFRVMLSRWWNDPKAKEFVQDMRKGKAKVVSTDAANDLTTREGIINQLVTATQQTSGKDSLSGLQTLAKIQGYDRPTEEAIGEERRSFFLPWVSVCKTCKLMQIFQGLKIEEE